MAETTTPAKKATAKPAADEPAEAPALLRAAESSDPAVHQVMAERQTAVLNKDEAGVAACDEALADLGYTL